MKKLNTLPILYTGQQFRVVRIESGLSVNKLHNMTKVSRTQILKYEEGELNPTISTYRKLLTALAQYQAEKEAANV